MVCTKTITMQWVGVTLYNFYSKIIVETSYNSKVMKSQMLFHNDNNHAVGGVVRVQLLLIVYRNEIYCTDIKHALETVRLIQSNDKSNKI